MSDTQITRSRDLTLTDVAKQLNVGRNTLFKMLRNKQVLNDENYPLDRYQRQGLLKLKHKVWEDHANGQYRPYWIVMVSEKGVEFIKQTINKHSKPNESAK